MLSPVGTESDDYANRLLTHQSVWWKRVLPVQAVYQWNIRRHHLGRTLDVGCGLGRNLVSLPAGSVGVDHNPTSVAHARAQGLTALTVDEFMGGELARESAYDSLLFAHVIEHLSPEDARQMVRSYLPYLRAGGQVFFICPQERGYASDHTHVTWTDGEALTRLARETGLVPERPRSFPFPRRVGRIFTYNEFNLVARKP